jgi:hypothetical protein
MLPGYLAVNVGCIMHMHKRRETPLAALICSCMMHATRDNWAYYKCMLTLGMQ